MDFQNNLFYFSEKNLDPNYYLSFPIRLLDLSTSKIAELPFNGIDLALIGDYLYYTDYSNPGQFDLVYDIYRVKVGDWNNSELIF
jgi:hypothetical protein